MVLLKDILNTESEVKASESPNTSAGVELESSQNHECGSTCKNRGNMPSPALSTSSNISPNEHLDIDHYHSEGTRRSSYDGQNVTQMSTPQSEMSSGSEEEQLICHWDHCGKVFQQAELLYYHLCKDHVGRRSQKNLQLNCKWGDCQVKTEKRDHITSHLRVHVSLKPFKCSKCGKNFKRPQDLKKHMKIHIESHIQVKKKRGPKSGSKRALKVDKAESKRNSAVAVSPASSDSPTNTGLPLISLQQLVANELPSYEPIYTPQLGARLQTVLPPIVSDDNALRNSTATSSAASFFSSLAQNMASARTLQTGYQQPFVIGEPAMTSSPPLFGGATNSADPRASAFGPRSYPTIPSLPPITAPVVHNERPSVLPSLSSVPILMPRHKAYERSAHFNSQGHCFSSVQKNSGKQEDTSDRGLATKLASLNLSDELDLEAYDETLESVIMMRDYLLCLLLEEEYEAGDEKDEAKLEDPLFKLSRYPQIVV